jgi:GDP-L-fucose synthase
MLQADSIIHVAGHRGLAGSAIWRRLTQDGFTNLVGRSSAELDLRDRRAVDAFYDEVGPQYVILAAARVGGIMANSSQPVDFLSENLHIQTNVLDAAVRVGVRKLLFLGSSCIYPKYAAQPISENALLTGPLEPTNEAYAIAKIAGIMHVQAVRRQFGLPWVSAMPTNLYGPEDNFDLATAHVLPAMLRRFHEAKLAGAASVTLWGTGTPRREFLHVDDLARACLLLLERYDDPTPINVGTGCDLTIADLASQVAATVGWQGVIEWDSSRPDGTPRKLLDVTRIRALGWRPEMELADGLTSTYSWFAAEAPRRLQSTPSW